MKTLKYIINTISVLVLGVNSYAQAQDPTNLSGLKTETFKVWGKCEMCKARIEKAAIVNGVSRAEWSTETKLLSLEYDSSVVKSDDILKKIAAVGHDSELFKADDKVYAKLPVCCRYNRKE